MPAQDTLETILPGVERPARYTGGEVNSIVKPFDSVMFHMALAFPDTYEIAMSHLGLQILYGLVNAREDSLAERVFMPWIDMDEAMRREGIPLFALESKRPASEFDVIGFSLQYEACYPTVLRMLDLAGIPRRRRDREAGKYPLVIAGGPCAFNPEPLADFFDLVFVGDAEESLPAFIDVWKAHRGEGGKAVAAAAARLEGIYAPGTAAAADAPDEKPVVKPGLVRDFENAYFPGAPIIPSVEAVHERIVLEVMRGCSRGCRFCQAGMTRRPVRVRSVAGLLKIAEEQYRSTGYDDIGLVSLATGDYPHLRDLVRRLTHRFEPLGVGLAFPSLRADTALEVIPDAMAKVRKGSITIAPEAGSDRLRSVINKGITEEGILSGVRRAFEAGWRRVKLYFMVGLPTETMEDVAAIADLVDRILAIGKSLKAGAGVNCSIAPFVPKPDTPFQWEPMAARDYFEEARKLLFSRLRGGPVKVSFHNIDRSIVEGALARGGRELAPVMESAADLGCFLDAWDEAFDYAKWVEAFASAGLDIEEYAARKLQAGSKLPWSHISSGVSTEFFLRERERAFKEALTPDCRQAGCSGCGLSSVCSPAGPS